MTRENATLLAGYDSAPLEDWYRHNYFNNEIDISGSGVEEYTFSEVQRLGGFDFSDLDDVKLQDGETVGSSRVRQSLADMFGTGDPDMVMTTNGSNEALQLAVRALLEPGDEIVTHDPCYHCHDQIAASIGCTVKKWALSLNGNYEQNVDELRALVTEKTRAIILNFPNNPTGVSISQPMLDAIIDIANDYDATLIWDAAFQALTYEAQPLRDPLLTCNKSVSVGTFSKAYGAPGLRFGWLISTPDVIAACVRQKDYGNLFVAPLVEFVAEKILRKLDDFSSPKLQQAAANREIVADWAQRYMEKGAWRNPDGGVCGLLKLPGNCDDVAFCNQLLEQQQVLLVPGSCFGMAGYVRLGFGGSTKPLVDGLHRLAMFLKNSAL